VLEFRNNVCTDRYSRYGAYGYGENENQEVPGFEKFINITWNEVQWGSLQRQCLGRNWDRYSDELIETNRSNSYPFATPQTRPPRRKAGSDSSLKYYPRSAVLIRTWHEMNWTENDLHHLRSLIMELSLNSGAEYEVFLMVHVKDHSLPIFSYSPTVEELKAKYIPAEFRDMVIFFNDKLLEAWYANIEEHE
jgi:hypothetical protein